MGDRARILIGAYEEQRPLVGKAPDAVVGPLARLGRHKAVGLVARRGERVVDVVEHRHCI